MESIYDSRQAELNLVKNGLVNLSLELEEFKDQKKILLEELEKVESGISRTTKRIIHLFEEIPNFD